MLALETACKIHLVANTVLLTATVSTLLRRLADEPVTGEPTTAAATHSDWIAIIVQLVCSTWGIACCFKPSVRRVTASMWLILVMEGALFAQLFAHGTRRLADCYALGVPSKAAADCVGALQHHLWTSAAVSLCAVAAAFIAASLHRHSLISCRAEKTMLEPTSDLSEA